ncbi:hypothetical protein BS78_05G262700 [Paspalum vaginatum]|nr:hypothetical protein BS78_05G262700 [Paspalum vaginatum]KAJ1277027.1 hypothetical protein BS78_05G262700 [Paspalum vaginatum]KAJ1277028.1 hypothetical protein BS78_05G262700 [Paspalum vaginatum]
MDDDRAAASWGPCEFQLSNWTAEEPAAAADVWAPSGLPDDPVEQYWPIDIFDSWSIQACVPGSRGAEQLVEGYYYYSAASQHQHDGPSENPAEAIIHVQNRHDVKENSGKRSGETTKVIVTNDSGIDARSVLEQVRRQFEDDMGRIEEKVHRYPVVLGALDESYTVPRIVAIGPYHHGKPHLMKAEKVKHMAATQCVEDSGRSLEELFGAVVTVAVEEAWSLYDKDTMTEKGIRYGDDFWHMMFFDACFLVQYILKQTDSSKVSFHGFFGTNRMDIFQDITMFENQLPWKVVETVLGLLPVTHEHNPIKEFIRRYRGYLQDQLNPTEDENPPWLPFDKDYRPPHLLGLLRHYTVGKISDDDVNTTKDESTPLISISAMELAEIGITLRANRTSTDLVRMGLQQEGALGAELSLAPLSLDHNRASYLVNMAAFELCTRGGRAGATCKGCPAGRRRAHQPAGAQLLHQPPGSEARKTLPPHHARHRGIQGEEVVLDQVLLVFLQKLDSNSHGSLRHSDTAVSQERHLMSGRCYLSGSKRPV